MPSFMVISLGLFCPMGKVHPYTLCVGSWTSHRVLCVGSWSSHRVLCVGSWSSHRVRVTTLQGCETRTTVHSTYPRRLESLTICRWHYISSDLAITNPCLLSRNCFLSCVMMWFYNFYCPLFSRDVIAF